MLGTDRLARLAAVLGWGPIATTRAVLLRYNAAGGNLLAGALAYSALFAIVPLLVVAAGVVGLLVGDAADRERVVSTIANVVPPLREIVTLVLNEAARSAGAISLAGAVALLWGGSRFILAFEEAMTRVGGDLRMRHVLTRNLLGMLAALALVLAVVLAAVVAGLTDFLTLAAEPGNGPDVFSGLARLVLAGMPVVLATLALALVYRFVPEVRPSWSATWRPALLVAIVLTVAARLFVFVAPRLIGAAATVGALATAFAALAWLGLSFQAILLGAAWVRQRDEARRFEGGPAGAPTRATPGDSALGGSAAAAEPRVRRQ